MRGVDAGAKQRAALFAVQVGALRDDAVRLHAQLKAESGFFTAHTVQDLQVTINALSSALADLMDAASGHD